MTTAEKTKSGWVIEITGSAYGCLEQGGVIARKVLYKKETIAKAGIDHNANPDDPAGCNDPSITNIDYLLHHAQCDKVIRKGKRIQ